MESIGATYCNNVDKAASRSRIALRAIQLCLWNLEEISALQRDGISIPQNRNNKRDDSQKNKV